MSLVRCAALLSAAVAMTAPADAQSPAGKPAQQPGQKPSVLQPQEKQFPVPSTWTVISLNGKPFSGRDRPTFSLDQQFRAKGFGGCNTYSATSYPLREQRLAIARALLAKPDWLFLDEATAALDEPTEEAIYRMLRERLPDTTIVSIGHRSTLAAFHDRRLELAPGRDGIFSPVDVRAPVPAQ